MSIVSFRKATRTGAGLVIGISGISGSGKTYTALQLAYGLAKYDASKVVFLDTENRRGSLYADCLRNDRGEVQPFIIGDLFAPFSPDRYAAAILEAQEIGAEVLVIDSVSHEWEGIGGCEEIANTNPRMPDWKKAKAAHKRFMNTLLQCSMHVIVCIRAREKVAFSKGSDGKTVAESLGVMPISEKNFMFEMTASLMMWGEGKSQQVMKCPDALRSMLGRESGYITAADGAALRAWVDGAAPVDKEVEAARASLWTATERGEAALRDAWAGLPKRVRQAISPTGCPDDIKAAAAAYDAARKESPDEQLAALNAMVLADEDESEGE